MFIPERPDIYNWDKFTIEHSNISSLQLMKQASVAFTEAFLKDKSLNSENEITVFAGSGNNGGDGLAIAILLRNAFINVKVYHCQIGNWSDDNASMLNELKNVREIEYHLIKNQDPFPDLKEDSIIVDALFGIGVNRPVEGYWAELIDHINSKTTNIFSVDVPSGLQIDHPSTGSIIKALKTYSFQVPKLAYLIPENRKYTGEVEIVDIGLSQEFQPGRTDRIYLTRNYISKLLKPSRDHFSHKGNFGHSMLICGSRGMMGAAILAARACLRSGVGKLTVQCPSGGNDIIQASVPEAMTINSGEDHINEIVVNLDYDSIGLGCGLGTDPDTGDAIKDFLDTSPRSLIIDADALNLISKNNWNHLIPSGSILTPHLKEFERLFGICQNHFERLELASKMADKYQCFIILKGANTSISTPSGKQYFNSSGNPGMATAGSGDVLTGIIAAFLAQGYPAETASILSVYIHGYAGDIASEEKGQDGLIASDIIDNIGTSIKELKS